MLVKLLDALPDLRWDLDELNQVSPHINEEDWMFILVSESFHQLRPPFAELGTTEDDKPIINEEVDRLIRYWSERLVSGDRRAVFSEVANWTMMRRQLIAARGSALAGTIQTACQSGYQGFIVEGGSNGLAVIYLLRH